MSNSNSGMSCSMGCWLLAAGVGLLTVILLLTVANYGLIAAVFMGGLATVVLGLLFSYLFCRELPPLGGAQDAPAPAPKAESAPAKAPAPAPAAAPAAAEPAVKESTQLPGEEELKSRKGEWKYEADAAAEDNGEPAAQPEGLSEARDGKADDLKQIKGVGPKLEKLLNSMGYFHFDQIAAWTSKEVAWVDENLKGFKGRVSRDSWVDQAKILASGGETEFSKRVDDGDVY